MASTIRSRVKAGQSQRSDFPVLGSRAALLIIDIQLYLSKENETISAAVTNIEKLVQAFRVLRDDPDSETTGCEVIFSYLQARTRDRRDISLDYKLSGPLLSKIPTVGDTKKEIFLPGCFPDEFTGKGDILLPKTSCSVFQSTNLDYLLRNLGIEQLVVVGQLTDECILSAVRDAADLGYLVTVVEDACAAKTPESHLRGLECMRGFARIVGSYQVMDEIVEGLTQELLESRSKSMSELIVDNKDVQMHGSTSSIKKEEAKQQEDDWNSSWARNSQRNLSTNTEKGSTSSLQTPTLEKDTRSDLAVEESNGENANKDEVVDASTGTKKKVTDDDVVGYLRDMGLPNVANDLVKVIDELKKLKTPHGTEESS